MLQGRSIRILLREKGHASAVEYETPEGIELQAKTLMNAMFID